MHSESSALPSFSRSNLFLFVFLFLLGLTIRHLPLRRLLFLLIAYTLLRTIFQTTTGLRNEEWQMGTMLAIELFTASDYLLITDDVQDLQLRAQKSQKPISDLPWLERLKWAIHLTLSPRGIGWKHESTYALPPRPASSSRKSFIMVQTAYIALFAILFHSMRYLNRANPVFAIDSPGLGAYGWMWRIYSILSFVLPIYAYINSQNRAYNVVLVATGISSPSECPPIFGAWKDAYTVRRFWGRTWHQIFRRFGSAHGKFLAHRVLNFSKGTFGSSYTQLFSAFVISGIIHQLGEYMLTRNSSLIPIKYTFPAAPSLAMVLEEQNSVSNGNLSRSQLLSPTGGRGGAVLGGGGGGSFWFFVLQAVVITFEDFAIRTFQESRAFTSYSKSHWWRIVGYLWVVAWFTLTVPLWLDGLVAAGLMDEGHRGGMTLEFVSFAILWRGKKVV